MSIKISTGKSHKLNVTTTPGNRIQINTGGGGGAGGIDTLVELRDVDASNVTDNETVVYDAASGKFKIETLPIVDGGSF
ncbi:hypothetical protein EB001_25630 [bacterium]|nr:hypothetical protein [bacterium]